MSLTTGNLPAHILSVEEWNDANSKTKFFQRYDGPYRIKTIALANQPVRRVLVRHFEYMSRNLFFISAFGRFLLGQSKEEEVIKAEDIATRTISKATESMRKRVEQARALMVNSGNEEEETHLSKNQLMAIPITTPGARFYAELLRLTDEFYTINYALWLDGEIDSQVKFRNESAARKEIMGAVKGIASQFMFILNLTRKKSDAEAQKAGTHDEAQLEQDAVHAVESEIGSDTMVNSVSAPIASNEPVEALKTAAV